MDNVSSIGASVDHASTLTGVPSRTGGCSEDGQGGSCVLDGNQRHGSEATPQSTPTRPEQVSASNIVLKRKAASPDYTESSPVRA